MLDAKNREIFLQNLNLKINFPQNNEVFIVSVRCTSKTYS